MPRKPICASCLYYFPAKHLPIEIEAIISPDYDGYCQHFEEERDRDEPTCEFYKKINYKKQVERN